MTESSLSGREANGGEAAGERRRSPRRPVPDVFVAVELSDSPLRSVSTPVSDTGGSLAWAGSAIDISVGGLGLTLPEDIPVGSEVLLTFWLDDATVFSRVPSVVVRKEHGFGLGAVAFRNWSANDRTALKAFLAAA